MDLAFFSGANSRISIHSISRLARRFWHLAFQKQRRISLVVSSCRLSIFCTKLESLCIWVGGASYWDKQVIVHRMRNWKYISYTDTAYIYTYLIDHTKENSNTNKLNTTDSNRRTIYLLPICRSTTSAKKPEGQN